MISFNNEVRESISPEDEDDFFSEVMVFLLLELFAVLFSGVDFNFRDDGDGVSVCRLLIPAVDRLLRRLIASFNEGMVLDAITIYHF